MESAPPGAIIYTYKFREWFRSLNVYQKGAWNVLKSEELRLLTEFEIRFEFPGISEIDMRIERFKRIYAQDFSTEQMEEITASMHKSLEKEFNEQNRKL